MGRYDFSPISHPPTNRVKRISIREYSIASLAPEAKDHKRIAILYIISITLFFFIGGGAAVMMRLQLLTPHSTLLEADAYNKMFTIHGIMMVFFFLIPSIPGQRLRRNFLLPLMIGTRDLAFPRINLLSWYLYIIGGVCTLAALVLGGVDTGWTFLPLPIQQHVFQFQCSVAGDRGHLYQRVFIDPHRPEFHCHDSQNARSRADLVSAAAVCLGDVCHKPDLHPWHAGGGHHTFPGDARTPLSKSEFSIPPSAVIPCSSSTCSGSTAIRPFTS